MTFNWDSSYESLPTDQLNRALIDNAIRGIKVGTRERMEVEHEWGPYTDEDTGRHRKGHVSVIMRGDATTRDALVNPQPGSLYLLEDGSDLQLFLYFDPAGGTNYSWEKISTLDHSSFADKNGGDPHPQYTLKNGGVMSGQLDMNGNLIKAPLSYSTYWGNTSLYGHRANYHPKVGNVNAIASGGIITQAKWSSNTTETSASLGGNARYSFPPYGTLRFFPQIYVEGATPTNDNIRLMGAQTNYYIAILNATTDTINFRYRLRFM